jgi:putative transposase
LTLDKLRRSGVLVNRAYRHKLVLDPEREGLCRRIAGCCRLVYNCGLEQRQLGWEVTGRGMGYTAHTYDLKEAKAAPGFEFLREAPAHCSQQALRDLDDGYQRFFTGQNAYPRPRKRGENDGFRFPDPDPKQIGVHEPGRHNQVRLPKLGWVSVRNSYPRLAGHSDGPRLFEGELKSITVKREADGWYASLCCEVKVETETGTGEAVGVDRGIANSVALSTGEMFHLPVITEQEWRTLGSLQSAVNRRAKGSRNREKARRRLARYRQRLARRKLDALHKLTTELAGRFSLVAIEELLVKNMTASAKGTVEEPGSRVAQKAGLNRAILDQSWGELERQLTYKLQWAGGELWTTPAMNTSRECEACWHVAKGSRESQAAF